MCVCFGCESVCVLDMSVYMCVCFGCESVCVLDMSVCVCLYHIHTPRGYDQGL